MPADDFRFRLTGCSSTPDSPSATPPRSSITCDALGVSHCYASSYLTAVPGSTHGYDVADPTRLNPELGDEAELRDVDCTRCAPAAWATSSTSCPNHMGIARSANPWWQDVLENGASSRYAPVFDIDWTPLKPELEDKVLLPVLGDAYGAVLERQEIQLEYDQGAFRARYHDTLLPDRAGHLRPDSVHRQGRPARRTSASSRTRGSSSSAFSPPFAICPDRKTDDPGAARRARSREGSDQAAAGGADGSLRRASARTSPTPSAV